MAVVYWVGKQRRLAKQMTLTVGTASTGGTITLTFGNGKTVVITPTTTNTTTTASELLAAIEAATDGEITELTVTASAAVLTFVGPDDGAPFTLSKTDGGANVTTLATSVSPKSPHDLADVLNYSTGALPVDTVDSLVFEGNAIDAKYNADALTAIELVSPGLTRRASYTGRWGLPATNVNGYPEYRAQELEIEAQTVLFEGNRGDSAGQFRLKNKWTGSAETITLNGEPDGAPLGSEPVELTGMPASSVVNSAGVSFAVAPLASQTGTVLTLRGNNCTVRVGPAATLSGTLNLVNVLANVKASWTTSLTTIGQSSVEVGGAATGVLVNESGYIGWRSTGNVGSNPVIGSGGTIDFTNAPSAVSIGGVVQMYGGSQLLDPAGRAGNFAYKLNHCTPQEVNVVTPDDKTFTLS